MKGDVGIYRERLTDGRSYWTTYTILHRGRPPAGERDARRFDDAYFFRSGEICLEGDRLAAGLLPYGLTLADFPSLPAEL